MFVIVSKWRDKCTDCNNEPNRAINWIEHEVCR